MDGVGESAPTDDVCSLEERVRRQPYGE